MAGDGRIVSFLPIRVLVCDDDRISCAVIRAMLGAASNITVHVVMDSTAALKELRAGGHDALLLDVAIPGVGGLEMTRMIRDLPPPIRHIPIIGMTVHSTSHEVERFLASGMDAVMTIPLNRVFLVETIAKLVVSNRRAPSYGSHLSHGSSAANPSRHGGVRSRNRAKSLSRGSSGRRGREPS